MTDKLKPFVKRSFFERIKSAIKVFKGDKTDLLLQPIIHTDQRSIKILTAYYRISDLNPLNCLNAERIVKTKLAEELIHSLIDEGLIEIEVCEDYGVYTEKTVRARLTVLVEEGADNDR